MRPNRVIAHSVWDGKHGKWDHSTVDAAKLIGADIEFNLQGTWIPIDHVLYSSHGQYAHVQYRAVVNPEEES